jgi:hypothetical protein
MMGEVMEWVSPKKLPLFKMSLHPRGGTPLETTARGDSGVSLKKLPSIEGSVLMTAPVTFV